MLAVQIPSTPTHPLLRPHSLTGTTRNPTYLNPGGFFEFNPLARGLSYLLYIRIFTNVSSQKLRSVYCLDLFLRSPAAAASLTATPVAVYEFLMYTLAVILSVLHVAELSTTPHLLA